MQNKHYLFLVLSALLGVVLGMLIYATIASRSERPSPLPPIVVTPTSSPSEPPTTSTSTSQTCQPAAIRLIEPVANASVTSPVHVRVVIDNRNPACRWTVFEAQAGQMILKNAAGTKIGSGILMTSENWMTTDPVEYQGEISVSSDVSGPVTLTIIEENPSGDGKSQTLVVSFTLTKGVTGDSGSATDLVKKYQQTSFRVIQVMKNPHAPYFLVVATEKRTAEGGNDTACGSLYTSPTCYFFVEPDYVYGADPQSRFVAKLTRTGAVDLNTKFTFPDADHVRFEAGEGDAGYSRISTWELNLKTGEVKELKREEHQEE